MEFPPSYGKKETQKFKFKKEKNKSDRKMWYPPATPKEYRRVRLITGQIIISSKDCTSFINASGSLVKLSNRGLTRVLL